MKRILLALLPWMAMTSVAQAQTRPADVVFTHMGTVEERCIRMDDECFVPFTFLDYVGWDYSTVRGFVDLKAEDLKFRIPTRDLDGTVMVPLKMTAEKLGADISWDGDHFMVLSPLNEVKIRNGHFTISSNLAVQPKVMLMDNPSRVVIDIQGAKLTRRTNVDLDGTSRIAQFKPDVVRIVLETEADNAFSKSKFKPGRKFDFDVLTVNNSTSASTPPKAEPKVPLTAPQQAQYDPASNPDMAPPTNSTLAKVPQTATVTQLSLDAEGPKSAALSLKYSGPLAKAPIYRRPDPDVVEIVLPGAVLSPEANLDVDGSSIDKVESRSENGNLIISLSLSRPMGVEFSLASGGMQIQLLKPEIGNGRLAGKVVVVDAGHGGHDAGTQAGGYSEKNLTLSIAKLVSAKLAAEGATVIMTRKTDVFISLNERPAIANRNGADFFVSIHINSNEISNSASGTITFYHKKDPIGQLLADCIHREILKNSGLGGMGVWSDGKIYKSGFAVLRGADMPAIMVECGFLNTAKDRKRMLTDDFQNAIATGVVKGIKVFLGDENKKN